MARVPLGDGRHRRGARRPGRRGGPLRRAAPLRGSVGGRRDRRRGVRHRRRAAGQAGGAPRPSRRRRLPPGGPGDSTSGRACPRWSRGSTRPGPGPAAADATAPTSGRLHRDGRVWLLEWRGRRSTVPDSKGLRDLAVLLARPGRAVPVLDLVEAAGGPPAAAAGADLGPVLDDTGAAGVPAPARRAGPRDRRGGVRRRPRPSASACGPSGRCSPTSSPGRSAWAGAPASRATRPSAPARP